MTTQKAIALSAWALAHGIPESTARTWHGAGKFPPGRVWHGGGRDLLIDPGEPVPSIERLVMPVPPKPPVRERPKPTAATIRTMIQRLADDGELETTARRDALREIERTVARGLRSLERA